MGEAVVREQCAINRIAPTNVKRKIEWRLIGRSCTEFNRGGKTHVYSNGEDAGRRRYLYSKYGCDEIGKRTRPNSTYDGGKVAKKKVENESFMCHLPIDEFQRRRSMVESPRHWE